MDSKRRTDLIRHYYATIGELDQTTIHDWDEGQPTGTVLHHIFLLQVASRYYQNILVIFDTRKDSTVK